MCIVHTSNFSTLVIHKILYYYYSRQINMKISSVVETSFLKICTLYHSLWFLYVLKCSKSNQMCEICKSSHFRPLLLLLGEPLTYILSIHTYTHIRMHTYAHKHADTHTHTQVHMYAQIVAQINASTHIRTQLCIIIHMHIHIYKPGDEHCFAH